MESLFIVLVCAHCIGDFALQTDGIARHKRKAGILLLHAVIHGGVTYVLLQQWRLWELPVMLVGIHYVIDAIKIRTGRSPKAFALDQAAHCVSLLALAWWATEAGWTGFVGRGWPFIVLAGGFCAVVLGSGFFVGEVAKTLMDRNEGLEEKLAKGLEEGGKRIGQLERALILLLTLINQPAGIGFLVAAKSVLRFKEAEDQALAEYILIGTLWSFSLAIGLSWLTAHALNCLPIP